MQKNTAGKWIVFAFEDEGGTNPGEPKTGDAANITANVRIDGGAANAVDDTNPTELEDGYYVFDITAAEANGDLILICPQSATANVNVIGVPGAVWTTPANFNDLGIETDGDLTQVNALPWQASWDAEVESECTDALVAIHLDHLLSADYDPASKPGTATALLNELVEDDAGVSRFTTNALEQAPSGTGGDATEAKQDQLIAAVITNAAGADIAADIIAVKAETASILVDTAEIGAAGAGLTALATQASVDTIDGIVDNILVDTAEIGAAGAGLTALATQASVDTIDGIVDTILVDTAELQTNQGNWLTATGFATAADLATVDTVVDAIKVKTDELTFTNANEVDANAVSFDGDLFTVPSTVVASSNAPTDTQDVYRGTAWSQTVEGIATPLTDATAIYFSVKEEDAADSAALIRVRLPLNGAGGDTGLVWLDGSAAGTATDAVITHTTYSGGTLNRFVVTVKGEATAVLDPTIAITASRRPGYVITSGENNGYVTEWKIVGTDYADDVLSQGWLRVRPDVTRATT